MVCASFVHYSLNTEIHYGACKQTISTVGKGHQIVDGCASSKYHADAVEAALTFKQSIEQPHLNTDARLNVELFIVIQDMLCSVYTILWQAMYCFKG